MFFVRKQNLMFHFDSDRKIQLKGYKVVKPSHPFLHAIFEFLYLQSKYPHLRGSIIYTKKKQNSPNSSICFFGTLVFENNGNVFAFRIPMFWGLIF